MSKGTETVGADFVKFGARPVWGSPVALCGSWPMGSSIFS